MKTYSLINESNIIDILNDEMRIFEKLKELNNTITLCNNETEYSEALKTLKEVIRDENNWCLYYYNEDEEKELTLRQFILHIQTNNNVTTINIHETEDSEIKTTHTFMIIKPS